MIVLDESVVEEFESKSRWLDLCPYFELSEIYLSEFVDLIFNRPGLSGFGEVCPFEDVQSTEYKLWLDQKKRQSSPSDDSHSVGFPIDYSGYRMWRYNPIVFYKDGKKNAHRLLLKDDEESMAMLESRKFAIMSPVTYVGRTCTYSNARYLYAFGIDLDGVVVSDIEVLVARMADGRIPTANLIVNSGHGIHVYYLLEKPVEMYEANIKLLNKMKAGLTKQVWYVSRLDHPQFQSVVQGFRLPGTLTKFGKPIRAFWNKNANMHTLEELNQFAGSEWKLTDEELAQLAGNAPYNPSRVTLKEAKEKWPEWYANRVIGHKRVYKTWKLHRGIYDWWLNILKDVNQVTEHHRYWCILTLAVYAVKSGVPREEVLKDALSLVPLFDTKTLTEDNHFTEDDVHDALKAYDANYNTWPIKTIEETTAIRIERNRRNGREQDLHLKIARAVRDIQTLVKGKTKWDENNGRKRATEENSSHAQVVKGWCDKHPNNGDKSQCALETGLDLKTVRRWWVTDDSRCAAIVKEWRKNNPGNENKSQCARETGLTRPTVRKWWNINSIMKGMKKMKDVDVIIDEELTCVGSAHEPKCDLLLKAQRRAADIADKIKPQLRRNQYCWVSFWTDDDNIDPEEVCIVSYILKDDGNLIWKIAKNDEELDKLIEMLDFHG